MSNKQNTTQKKGSRSGPKSSSRNTKSNNSNRAVKSQPTKRRNNMARPVVVNVASTVKLTKRDPVISMTKDHCLISDSCLIGPVYKPVTQAPTADSPNLYTAFRLRCNPGSQATFGNWLPGIATRYEFYRFKKLKFYYMTRSASTREGSIILSPDYDSADGQTSLNEQALFANKASVDDSVWKRIELNLSPAAMNRLFKAHAVMSDPRFATTSQDVKTIDVAQVFCCIDSSELPAIKFGKLFVDFEVELFEPQQVTEPVNLGSFVFYPSRVGVPVTPSSTQPFAAVIPSLSMAVANNLMVPSSSIPSITYPTATLGQFTRDFNGLMMNRTDGTGVTTSGGFYLGTDPNTPAGAVGDVAAPFSDNSTTGGIGTVGTADNTKNLMAQIINAKAGQYLKFTSPTATTITKIAMEMGGLIFKDML